MHVYTDVSQENRGKTYADRKKNKKKKSNSRPKKKVEEKNVVEQVNLI